MIKKDRKRVSVTKDMILQIELAEKGMNIRNISKGDKNKSIKTMTGIKSTDTIRLIRESGFNYDKYKESLPLRYPQSYAKKSARNGVGETDQLPLDYAADCETQIVNYLNHQINYSDKVLESIDKIKILNDCITFYLILLDEEKESK